MATSMTAKKKPPGELDIKDTNKLILEKCEALKKQEQDQIERERVFFKAYMFNKFIDTVLQILKKDSPDSENKTKSKKGLGTKSRIPSSLKTPPAKKLSTPVNNPPTRRTTKLVRKPSPLADNSEMLRYMELAELNKPIIVERPKVKTKMKDVPKAHVTWSPARDHISIRMGRPLPQRVNGNAATSAPTSANLPPTKPWKIKQAYTIAGEMTTRFMDEKEVEALMQRIGRPYTAPASSTAAARFSMQDQVQTNQNKSRPGSCNNDQIRRDQCPITIEKGVLCWGQNTKCDEELPEVPKK